MKAELPGRTSTNVNFTPNLSLELFAQPLLASGAYERFQEFARDRAALFRAPSDNAFALKISYWVGL
ncbi:MAG TPA: hypothetical protein VGR37_07135 [Longimicrobiaceae bacterium]|nr:hypothetical protein [Longimicrobiaceae bacterium]